MRFLFICMAIIVASCKQGPSDKDIENDLSSKMRTTAPGVIMTVKNGVVTLSGTCPDESCKHSSETAAKETKGVKEVVNNIIISAPPAPAPTVEITSTDTLQTSLNSLLSAYKTVKGTVSDGVITLTGEIKRSQLTPLMQSVNELKPKRVVNNLQIK
jgi:hyperosmotically inducible periplasmic protein